jgi:hypothetical protein
LSTETFEIYLPFTSYETLSLQFVGIDELIPHQTVASRLLGLASDAWVAEDEDAGFERRCGDVLGLWPRGF